MGNSCCDSREESKYSTHKPDMQSFNEELQRATSLGMLKHVPEDSKSKNRTDKTSVVPGGLKKQVSRPLSDDHGRKGAPKGKPSFQLQSDRDWVVENYEGATEPITITDAKIRHNLCVRDCDGITVQVKGKINNASIDRCNNTHIVLQDMISTIELIHCEKTEVQILGKAPSFAIDNSNGVTLFLSREGKDCKITTARSGEINVSFPSDADADDWLERPIPEQFVSVIESDVIKTTVSDLYN